MRKFVLTWCAFLVCELLLLATDYLSRVRSPDFRSGGLAELGTLQVAVGVLFLIGVFVVTKRLGVLWFRLVVVLVQIPFVLGFLYFACLVYVIEAGIDSL